MQNKSEFRGLVLWMVNVIEKTITLKTYRVCRLTVYVYFIRQLLQDKDRRGVLLSLNEQRSSSSNFIHQISFINESEVG